MALDGDIKLGVSFKVDKKASLSQLTRALEPINLQFSKSTPKVREFISAFKDLQKYIKDAPIPKSYAEYLKVLQGLRTESMLVKNAFDDLRYNSLSPDDMSSARDIMEIISQLSRSISDNMAAAFKGMEQVSLGNKLDPFVQAQKEMAKQLPKEDVEGYEVASKQMANLFGELTKLINKKKDLEKQGLGLGFAQYDKVVAELKEAKKAFDALAKARDAGLQAPPSLGAEHSLNTLKDVLLQVRDNYQGFAKDGGVVKASLNTLKGAFVDMGTKAVLSIADPKKLIVDLAIKEIPKLGKSIGNALHSGINKAISQFRKLGNMMKDVFSSKGRGHRGIQQGMKRTLSNILRVTLGIRSMFFLIKRLRTAAINALNTIAVQFPEFNTQLSQTKTLFEGMKGAIGTMIQPLVSALLPVINQLIIAVTTLMQKLGSLFATMTGQGFVYKATAQWQDYADAIDGANKKLGAYDKLNVISDDKGGGQTLKVNYSKGDIDEDMVDLWERIKQAWANADFSEFGAIIGEKLQGVLLNIPWETITSVLNTLGASIATFINGLVEVDNLGTDIGISIGLALNAIATGINSFVTSLNWDSLGKFISDGISGLVYAIDLNLIGDTIATSINGVTTTIDTIITETPWDSFATKFGDSINNLVSKIKWEEIGTTLATGLNTLRETITTFLDKIDFFKLGANLFKGISNFITNIDWGQLGALLSEKVTSFLDFINGAIAGIDWVKLGSTLMFGIFDFLANINIGEILGKIIVGIVTLLDGILRFLLGAIPGLLAGIIELLYAWFGEIPNLLGTIFDGIAKWITEKVGEAGTNIVSGFIQPIADFFLGIHDWIKEHIVDPFVNGIKSLFGIHSPSTVMSELGGYLIEGLKQGIGDIWAKIGEAWENVKLRITELWNTIKTNLITKAQAIKDNLTNTFNNLKTSMGTIFDNIWGKIKGVINSILGGVEKMANGVINAVNKMIGALNGLHFDIPDWVPWLGGKSFGLSIPTIPNVSIPKLAQGAVIPPNREFLAMLGDQKSGTNIEAPLETIQQALANVLAQSQSNQPIVLQLDGKTVAKVVWDENQKRYKQTGVRFSY